VTRAIRLRAVRQPGQSAAAIAAIVACVVIGLLVLAPAYGFHRDELYFIVAGRHPAWGYVDQPPLTPLISAASVALLGLEPLALRFAPALAIGGCVLLVAAIAGELGGSPRARVLGALVAAASGYLAAGHLASTATYDLLAWAAMLWLATRILRGDDPRLWLAVGLVAGIGLQNKHLVLFLVAGLAVGLVVHRRDLLRARWPWLGAALALLIWAPNVAWQLANGLPQLEMARNIGGSAAENRVKLVPELLLLAGPLLFPVAAAGLWRLGRAAEQAPFRSLATAFLVILASVLLTGGKSYYVAGALPPLMAAGAISLDRWLAGGGWRLAVAGGAWAGSLAIVALLTLPVLPPASLATSPVPGIYKESAEQVGWPELVATVEQAVGRLPPETRSRAIILTANYGEAGALQLLGEGLPDVFSGHNSYWSWGPPDDSRTAVVLVGFGEPSRWAGSLGGCVRVATIRNAVAMPNEEHGASVAVCDQVRRRWSDSWIEFRHYN
jgi:4-amino-4-deoxy-L-arabinose transferase-like glycosyltransferase